MYIIIVGAGRIGTPLIDLATGSGHEVVVIETDKVAADRIADEYDCIVINADATRMSTLDDADVDEADALISTTDRDATNVMVCLLAKKREVPAVVSVVHDPDHMDLFKEIGISTMENPSRLIAEHLFRAVVRPSIVDYMRIGEAAEVFEITIDEDAPIAGKTIREAAADGTLQGEVLIVAVERGEDEPVTPQGNTPLRPGDLLTVYSAEGATPDVTDIFGHYED
ncbi:potassium channel family protein [Halostella pelagica]|uniref:potassium channel family protein n=1 Tax=Halostella pelagica TaxID=2583824 RepID=UPI001081DC58|nr:TrkA family potassium uptake protein [Halostella pelagica]